MRKEILFILLSFFIMGISSALIPAGVPTPTPGITPSPPLPPSGGGGQGNVEIRGTVWDESGSGGALSGTAAWTPINFAAFFYDLKDNLGRERLAILQPGLGQGGTKRTIDEKNLTYSTQADKKMLKVVKIAFNGDVTLATAAGLEKTGSGQAFEGGKYAIVGWQGEKYVALNGKIDKLTTLLFEHGSATTEKITLTPGQTWEMGGGWALTALKISAGTSPRQALLVLSKDGIKKGAKVVPEKGIYTYVEESIAGETDVPLFLTYVDSIFQGATTNMVQLRYTWLVSGAVTIIKAGDKFGVFEVKKAGPDAIVLESTTSITLCQDGTIDLMGALKFRVADRADVLRFYPFISFQCGW